MTPAVTDRAAHVETIRGLACLMLVAYHVVGDTPMNGLQLPLDHPLSAANHLFVDMRMPLFSFLSGLVFHAIAGPGWSGVLPSVARKARRLLVPMVFVSTLHWLAKGLAVEEERPLWHILVLPYEHFWFLQATFLLMAAHYALTALLGGRDVRAAGILLVAGAVLFVGLDRWRPDVFSSYKAAYLAAFFFTGYLAGHWRAARDALRALSQSRWRGPAAVALLGLAVMVAVQTATDAAAPAAWSRDAVSIAVGLSVCIGLFVVRPVWSPLVRIGGYSYAIFLYHVFFTAGSRIVLERMFDWTDPWSLFLAGLVAGLAGPVGVWHLFIRNPATALLFLGIDLKPRGRTPSGRSGARPVRQHDPATG